MDPVVLSVFMTWLGSTVAVGGVPDRGRVGRWGSTEIVALVPVSLCCSVNCSVGLGLTLKLCGPLVLDSDVEGPLEAPQLVERRDFPTKGQSSCKAAA